MVCTDKWVGTIVSWLCVWDTYRTKEELKASKEQVSVLQEEIKR